MTDSPHETISSEERFERLPFGRTGGPPDSAWRMTALTTAVSLVLAGGVATAAYRGLQSSPGPETLIPGSAFAVATADLSLPGGQDDALQAFADHFPGSPTHDGDGSALDRLLRGMFADSSDPHVDYDDDVAPWLGDHVAIAGWLDGEEPRFEALLQSTDDDAARRHLGELMDDDQPPLVFSDGYAVISDTAEHARAALDAAARSSLADDAHYTADVDRLPADEAVTGWVDGPGVGKLLQGALSGGLATTGIFGMFGLAGMSEVFEVRLAAGLHVADDYTQLDVYQVGGPQAGTGPSARLTELPGDTVAALEIGSPGPIVDGITAAIRTFGGLRASSSVSCSGATVFATPDVPPGTPHRRRLLRQLRQFRHEARQQNACPDQPPAPTDPFEELSAATGLRLPDDLRTLLGETSVVSYGGIQIGRLPDIALRSHPTDLAAARDAADRLRARLAEKFGVTLAVEEVGGDLVIATSADYAAAVREDGDLAAQELAGKALGDVPAEVSTAGFVDLSRIWPLVGTGIPEDVTHLKAVGFWADQADGAQHSQLRLVVG